MTEIAFPVLGVAFIVIVALPLFALVAKVLLVILERDDVGGPLHGFNARYLLLTGSTILPLAWFFSAAVHQAETGRSVVACLLDHDTAALCVEPGLFAVILAAVVVGCSATTWRRSRAVVASALPTRHALLVRLEALLLGRPGQAPLREHARVTGEPRFAIGTQGLVRPHVVVGPEYAAGLSDDALAGALAHEAEHVRAFDPLRYLLLEFAMAVNPFGRWLLAPHAARWLAAREMHCDREAVLRGARPLALAEAIVRAARPALPPVVSLGAHDATLLRFRVAMLLAFAERRPSPCCHRGPSAFPVACLLLALALALPHNASTAALDAVHMGAERALTYLPD